MVDFEPDVGVLIVHGIGTQKEDAELRQWVDPVLGYLDACRPAADTAPGPRILQPNPGDSFVRMLTPPLGPSGAGRRQRWLIGEAWWADAFDVPDRKEVSRWLAGVASWFLYLFVVRLWRRFFVDRWHLLAGVALATSIAWLVREAAGAGATGYTWLVVAVAALGVALTVLRRGKRLGAVVVAATVLIGYPLAALATTAVVALWLVGLLPGKISEKARATQLGLAQSVGDVYALIASRRREQAMFDSLAAAATRLATAAHMDGRPLVLIAHSQGAALTYRALNNDGGLREALSGRKVTLITYGAGIVPIHVLEHRLRGPRPGWQWLQGLAGLVGLLLLAFSLGRVAADSVDVATRWVTNASVLLVVASFVATWRQERRARCKDDTVRITPPSTKTPHVKDGDSPPAVCIELRSPDAAHLRWVDLWAPWDPVPNGPLSLTTPCNPSPCGPASLGPPGVEDEFLSCRVANLHQPWRDHVVYRDNPEDVVSRWVGEIAVRADSAVTPRDVERPGRPDAAAATARDRRRRRGRDLLLGQVIALVLGLVAVVRNWDDLDDLGRRAARRLPLRSGLASFVDAVPHGFRDGVFGDTRDSFHLQGLLVSVAVVLVVIAAGSFVVAGWQATATRRYLDGQADAKLRAVGGGAASVVAALAVFGFLLWAAFGLEIDEVPTRVVRVHPASIVGPSRVTTASRHTEVRFAPVGTGDDTPVAVTVGSDVEEVELDEELEYRVTATTAGGKDCTASPDLGPPIDVRVSCTASGGLLPAAGNGS